MPRGPRPEQFDSSRIRSQLEDLEAGRLQPQKRKPPYYQGYRPPRNPPPRKRFHDAVRSVVADNRRKQIQARLQEGLSDMSLDKYRKGVDELKEMKDKKIRTFYEGQNETLNDWLAVDMLVKAVSDDVLESFDPQDEDQDGIVELRGGLAETHEHIEPHLPQDEREQRQKGRRNARWAININVLANILLLAAKVVAAFFSSSLSLIASLVDSVLDLLCTIIIWTTNKLVSKRIDKLQKLFPIGRRRLEPIGILVFSVIMIVSFLQILQESVKKLLPSASHETATLPPLAIFAMLSTIILKGVIWIGCARIKTSQVQALAQDCKTDVYFNTLSLLFPLIGRQLDVWWLDPVGAGLLSLYIVYDWASTCLDNVARLTGVGVGPRLQQKLMFMAWRFSPLVQAYKSVTAYHAGDGAYCEIDILLPADTPLEEAHDIAETLQYCCESLDEVDRAFVSVDYSIQGPSGHAVME